MEATVPILPLPGQEAQVLELYDKLQVLRLEIALLQARNSYEPDGSVHTTEQDTYEAQSRLLDLKALSTLRNDAVESVLTVNPVLEAAHSGANRRRTILPLIKERDAVSATVSHGSSDMVAALAELTELEVEGARVSRRNVELATDLVRIVGEAKRAEVVEDLSLLAELGELEKELKASRQRQKIMKSLTGAVVAGSGVDWAKDAVLKKIVLDSA